MRIGDLVIAITGASSGIGAALAREAHAQGARVVLAARREERLAELEQELRAQESGSVAGAAATAATAPEKEPGRCLRVRCDVTSDEDCERLVAATLERFGRLDVLIANAGFGVVGDFEKLELDDYRRQLETNFYGALRSARAALPALRESGGVLALMGSAVSYFSLAGVTPYSVSKYALRAFAEGLGRELEPQIRVLHIAPGFVASEFRQVDNDGRRNAEAEDPIPRWLVCPADRAARTILRAIRRRRREIVVTGHARLITALARHAPWLFGWILRRSGVRGRERPSG
jgi:NAD(P)-dependent dehydrogenase (short-subunit alcohol dehydrogenase family)